MTSRFDQTTSRPSRRTISVKVLSIEHLGSSISYGEAKHVTSTLLFLSFLLCLTALITGCGSAASANSTAVATVTSTPQAPLSIASSTLTEADTAAPYIATLSATGGVKPYRRSIATRALPSGIQLGASSGTITGMTALSGSYPFTAKVTDSNGQGATLVLAPAVSPTLAIASLLPTLAAATVPPIQGRFLPPSHHVHPSELSRRRTPPSVPVRPTVCSGTPERHSIRVGRPESAPETAAIS